MMDKRPVCTLTTIHVTTKVRRTLRVDGGQEEMKKPAVVECGGSQEGWIDQTNF